VEGVAGRVPVVSVTNRVLAVGVTERILVVFATGRDHWGFEGRKVKFEAGVLW
jgi:hypothetical protein